MILADSPLVSVVIPAYNACTFLPQALESVFGQEYRPIEVIVVDDGSTDGTYELLRGRDDLRLIRQENKGEAAARNVGITQAQGEWIAFLDADDIWLPGKLTTQLAKAQENPSTGVIYGGFVQEYYGRRGKMIGRERVAPDEKMRGQIFPQMLDRQFIAMDTVIARRSLCLEVGGFPEDLRHSEDYLFHLRCARVTPYDFVPDPVAVYRFRIGSTSTDITDTLRCVAIARERVLKEQKEHLDQAIDLSRKKAQWARRDYFSFAFLLLLREVKGFKIRRELARHHRPAGWQPAAWEAMAWFLSWLPVDIRIWGLLHARQAMRFRRS